MRDNPNRSTRGQRVKASHGGELVVPVGKRKSEEGGLRVVDFGEICSGEIQTAKFKQRDSTFSRSPKVTGYQMSTAGGDGIRASVMILQCRAALIPSLF
jgi:hypothetical protein